MLCYGEGQTRGCYVKDSLHGMQRASGCTIKKNSCAAIVFEF